MRIFVPAKALTLILTTRSMAAFAPCELTQVPHGAAGCSAAHTPASMRAACLQRACGILSGPEGPGPALGRWSK